MDQKETVIEVTEPQNFDELFEELSVIELEDRLELAGRCICRVKEVPTE